MKLKKKNQLLYHENKLNSEQHYNENLIKKTKTYIRVKPNEREFILKTKNEKKMKT